jgi:hypothetical protein
MPVICQLCQKSFDKLISSTHLKFAHLISSNEYRNQFGASSLASPEYREQRSRDNSGENNGMSGKRHSQGAKQKMSQELQGRIPHNKGKKVDDPVLLKIMRDNAQKRVERWKENGNHPRIGAQLSEATKEQISLGIQKYAKENPEVMKARAQKSLLTKKQNGYDFGSTMRGKHHSPESRIRIRKSSVLLAEKKRIDARNNHLLRAESANVSIEGYNGALVGLRCNKCSNTFEMTSQYLHKSKFRKDICPYCRQSPTKSKAELEVLDFVREICSTKVLSGNRNQIFPLELDIYIPEKNLAIEYCGLYWHSEQQGKDKNYHLHKFKLCQDKGIRLISIFEDEWTETPSIVKSRLRAILGQAQKKVMARKCHIKAITSSQARTFCRENHVQGSGSCSVAYGLYWKESLVSVMTFSKPNVSKGQKTHINGYWEMNRFCSLVDHQVQGAAGKLFSRFVKDHSPISVFSYADARWSNGDIYQTLGFEFQHHTPPNYWYIRSGECMRRHRFSLRKNSTDDPQLTEWQNRQAQGWNRIWDCGSTKWVWENKKPEH